MAESALAAAAAGAETAPAAAVSENAAAGGMFGTAGDTGLSDAAKSLYEQIRNPNEQQTAGLEPLKLPEPPPPLLNPGLPYRPPAPFHYASSQISQAPPAPLSLGIQNYLKY